jgi:NitT/TauT family transport system substrate-binding protein
MKSLRILAAMAVTLALSFAATAQPVKLRIQWSATPGHHTPLMPVLPKYGPDVFKHYGKSYVVEPVFMGGGGAALTALGANEVDLASINPQAFVLGLERAKLDIKAIGQQLSEGVPGYHGSSFWVRADEVKTPADLRGKVIGVSALGTNIDASARTLLAKHGLEAGKDYQFAEIRFTAQLAALESKRIDAAILLQPFNLIAKKNPAYKPLFAVSDVIGAQETSSWIGKSEWIAKNRGALVDFLEDNIRMRRWMYDPKTRPEALKLVAEVTKQPAENFAEWVFTEADFFRDPNCLIDVERFQKNVDDLHALKILPMTATVAPHIDNSLAKEAAARIK